MTSLVVGGVGPEPRALWRHPAFVWTLGVAALAAAGLPLAWAPLSAALTDLEFALAGWLPEAWIDGASWSALPFVAFAAGLLASLSPCVLPLVPINVALIGASDASGLRAASLSGRFVLGAAAALALLGLAADLAGFLLIEQRGPVFLLAGAMLFTLGLAFLEILPLPGAGWAPGGARRLGPVAAGAAFALVTSPCASPLLAGVLTAASVQAVPGLTPLSMVAFSLGYTALVFAAGVFGGGLVRRLRKRSFEAPRAAAGALLLVAGGVFAVIGARWF